MPYCIYSISRFVIYLGGLAVCCVLMPVIQVSAFLFPVLEHCGSWTSVVSRDLVGDERLRHQEDGEEGARDVLSCGNRWAESCTPRAGVKSVDVTQW
jgi:hypothetical protein